MPWGMGVYTTQLTDEIVTATLHIYMHDVLNRVRFQRPGVLVALSLHGWRPGGGRPTDPLARYGAHAQALKPGADLP